jgi:hypothetical protein
MMNINSEKIENPMVTLPYEQPSLKKYGTMKEFTLGSSGSRGDSLGRSPSVSLNQTPNANDPGTGGDRAIFDEAVDSGGPPGRD